MGPSLEGTAGYAEWQRSVLPTEPPRVPLLYCEEARAEPQAVALIIRCLLSFYVKESGVLIWLSFYAVHL